MLDHIGFPVADFQRSRGFYIAVLRPLGYGLVMEVGPDQGADGWHAGFGKPGRPQFWINGGEPIQGRLHVAFMAQDQEQVDHFYAAALGAGAFDNGAPGLRPHYHPNYYGAVVIDPDGHNVEAVCHAPR